MSARMGVVFRPQFKPDSLSTIAARADSAGVDELWIWEDCFLQGGIAQAAVVLASTERLIVGIGVLPAPLRNVVATAMEIATLDAMFPGRVRLGIGHGVQDWMRQAGAAVASPLTLMREYMTALRDLFAGRSVSADGRYVHLEAVRLDWPPAQPLGVLIGGTGPKTLRLAGEVADGVILDSRYTPETVREALAHVDAGRDQSGSPFSVVMFLECDADQIAGSAGAYIDAGVDTVVLQPAHADVDMEEFVTAIGAAARSHR